MNQLHYLEYLPHPDEPLAPTSQDHTPAIHELFHKVITKFERRATLSQRLQYASKH